MLNDFAINFMVIFNLLQIFTDINSKTALTTRSFHKSLDLCAILLYLLVLQTLFLFTSCCFVMQGSNWQDRQCDDWQYRQCDDWQDRQCDDIICWVFLGLVFNFSSILTNSVATFKNCNVTYKIFKFHLYFFKQVVVAVRNLPFQAYTFNVKICLILLRH